MTVSYAPLTDRQLQVAVLYADTDLTLRQIADRLYFAEGTVRDLVSQVYRALGVHSRPALRSAMLDAELGPAGGVR